MSFSRIFLALTFIPLFLLSFVACTQAPASERRILQGGFDDYVNRSFDRADYIASEYIKKYPQDPNVDEAFYLRGMALQAKDQPAPAAEYLHTAISKTKREDLKAKSYRALGDMAFEARRFEQSIQYYRESQLHYPTNRPEPMVLYRLGAAYQNLGRWAEARPYFVQAAPLIADSRMRQRAIIRSKATSFSLQFAAYTTQNGAQVEGRKLIALGVKVVIVPEFNDTTLLYTLRAGSFPDLATAEDSRRQLINRFPIVTVVP